MPLLCRGGDPEMTAANNPLCNVGAVAALDPAGCRLVTMLVVLVVLVVLGEWVLW
ncbi:hypothetical protein [Chromobacterium sp. CV08]|uniref:hypothetical protein n=1 Tax=Chromobacterium sp. CV08 TaxID=3133274 RepID=UPI003DA8F74D